MAWFCKVGHHFGTINFKEDDMNNTLLDSGIILPSGEVNDEN